MKSLKFIILRECFPPDPMPCVNVMLEHATWRNIEWPIGGIVRIARTLVESKAQTDGGRRWI